MSHTHRVKPTTPEGCVKTCHQAVVQKIYVLTFFKVNIITEEFLQFFKILFLFSLSLVSFSFQCEFTSFRLISVILMFYI